MADDLRPTACGLTITELCDRAKLVLRADDNVAAAAGGALDTPRPDRVNRAVGGETCRMLRLGPDDYLLIPAIGRHVEVVERLAAALAERHHALVDISARLVALELRGNAVRDALAAACPIELHPAAFGPGQATRTLLGKTEIILDCLAPEHFRLLVNRSFAAYLRRLVAEVGREFHPAAPGG